MNGSGCKTCPVKSCDAMYSGSRCKAYRDRLGLGDPEPKIDRILTMSDNELEELVAKVCGRTYPNNSNA